jgi:hypothetical protein
MKMNSLTMGQRHHEDTVLLPVRTCSLEVEAEVLKDRLLKPGVRKLDNRTWPKNSLELIPLPGK